MKETEEYMRGYLDGLENSLKIVKKHKLAKNPFDSIKLKITIEYTEVKNKKRKLI